jgi:hypothetical protein
MGRHPPPPPTTTIVSYDSGYILLSQIADDLNKSLPQMRRWSIAQGFVFLKMRTPNGHLALLSLSDAKALVERRRQLGFAVEKQ